MKEWLKIAMRRDIRQRGLKVCLIVGTILTAINQGGVILSGAVTVPVVIRMLLTYCVPYCVSTYASVDAIRRHHRV